MATTPEGKVKLRIKQILKEQFPDAWFFWPRGTMMGRSGIPDLIICYRGYFIGVEVKAGRNRPTALQERELQGIQAAGGAALVVNEVTLQEFVRLLERYRDASNRQIDSAVS